MTAQWIVEAMRASAPLGTPAAEQDSYLASLSDLMVGLLFVFIIILMSFALRLREAEDRAQAATHELTHTTAELSAVTKSLLQDAEVRNDLLREIEETLKRQGVQVHLDLRNGVLRLPEELLFDSGSADFREVGLQAVAKLADTLVVLLPCYGRVSAPDSCAQPRPLRLEAVFVEGHTDNVDIRSARFPDNWALSYARARHTYRTLMDEAPSLEELKNEQGRSLFSMSAYADKRPVADNGTDEGRRRNRRIGGVFL